MDLNGILAYILTAVGSVVTWLWANKTIIPSILEWWKNRKKERKKDTIDAVDEVLNIKENTIDVTEKQFTVLLNQITALETELQNYAEELQKLRTTILRLNAKLYDKSLIISELQKKCCENMECPHRIHCKNYLCQMVEEQ